MEDGKKKSSTAVYSCRINVRVCPEDMKKLKKLAFKDRQTPSAWIRFKLGELLNSKK